LESAVAVAQRDAKSAVAASLQIIAIVEGGNIRLAVAVEITTPIATE